MRHRYNSSGGQYRETDTSSADEGPSSQQQPVLSFRHGPSPSSNKPRPVPATRYEASPFANSPSAFSSNVHGKIVRTPAPVSQPAPSSGSGGGGGGGGGASAAEQQVKAEVALQKQVATFQLHVTKPRQVLDPYEVRVCARACVRACVRV
jgi:hypothetical protein